MLGDKINFKDVDFMILLSTYMLNEDYSTIHSNITKLAEMGQINSIQHFYLMKAEFEINKKVDNNLKNMLNKEGFEKDIALRSYLIAKSKTDHYFPGLYSGIEGAESVDVEKLEKEVFKALKEQLSENLSPILFERYIELKTLLNKKITQVDRQNLKKVQAKLLKLYKEDNKNILVTFTLGKHLLRHGEDDEHKLLGKQILSEVSKLKLSKQLEERISPQMYFLPIDKKQIKATNKKNQAMSSEKDKSK